MEKWKIKKKRRKGPIGSRATEEGPGRRGERRDLGDAEPGIRGAVLLRGGGSHVSRGLSRGAADKGGRRNIQTTS